MMNPPAQGLNTYLLLRVTDTIRLRCRRQCSILSTSCPTPHCFQFENGHLCGAPTLQDVCLTPARGGCGCCLDATLCLPLCLHLMRECECLSVTGSVSMQVQALLRCSCCTPLQFVAQAEVCVCDVQLQDGCLCVVYDITVTIYAACLSPVQLPVLCAPSCCAPDCSPFFNKPLYPELPRPCR